jgi:hypothetical protein
MAFEWLDKWAENNWNNKSKAGKVKTAYGVATLPFMPAFTGMYGAKLGHDLGRALEVSGYDVDPKRFAKIGSALGAAGGLASWAYPSVNIGLNPLMNAALGSSLLEEYDVPRHIATAAEHIDPLNVNRKMDNVPFWDRVIRGLADPSLMTDAAIGVRDLPGIGDVLRLPVIRDIYKQGAAKAISGASKLRSRINPEYNYYEPEDLQGTDAEGKPRGLDRTPLEDWGKQTAISFINPKDWVDSYVSLWDTLTGE